MSPRPDPKGRDPFVETLVDDLRKASADLLDPGLAPSAVQGRARSGSFAVLLSQVRQLTSLVPRLWSEQEQAMLVAAAEPVASVSPVRARLPRRASDWARVESRLLPRRWERMDVRREPDPAALSWILFVAEQLGLRLDAARERFRGYRSELESSANLDSYYARLEQSSVSQLAGELEDAAGRLVRVAEALRRRASGLRLTPRARIPRPYPIAPSWLSLRRLADAILFPDQALRLQLAATLEVDAATADVPFLYQRWCGLQIVRTLESRGWVPLDAFIGPLFLGGRVRWRRGATQVTLWLEPHLTGSGRHESGLFAERGEASPDFIFITPGPGGSDAFLLDATLAPQEGQENKGRYRHQVAFDVLHRVAGTPTRRRPLRSWAVSPSQALACSLHDPDGRTGTVPLHPLSDERRPLVAWLEDVEEHAAAWAERDAQAGEPSDG